MHPPASVTGFRGVTTRAIFGLLALSLCAAASADPLAESRTVRFTDLDVSTPAAAHALYGRIRAAAQVVCSYYFFLTDSEKARCVRDATAEAVSGINQPALYAVYAANNRTSVANRRTP